MLSDLRRRKFTNYFSILDRSGNGLLARPTSGGSSRG